MLARHIPIATLVLLLPARVVAGDAELAMLPLTVRVYDSTNVSEATRTAALGIARATLAAANIDTAWRRCDRKGPDSGCEVPPSGSELVIRIVGAHTLTADRRTMVLGDAMLEGPSGEGRLATIYFNRVERLAQAASVDAGRLLGHAIAHELGHLLLATAGHARHGLMRAVWSDERLRRALDEDWKFTTVEIAAIRGRMAATAHAIWND